MKRTSFFKSLAGLALSPVIPGLLKAEQPTNQRPPFEGNEILVLSTCEGNALYSIEVRPDVDIVGKDIILIDRRPYYVHKSYNHGFFQRLRIEMLQPAPVQIKIGDKVELFRRPIGEFTK